MVNDVIYFPISGESDVHSMAKAYFPNLDNCPGVLAAVTDNGMTNHQYYIAYFSLRTRRLLKTVYMANPITRLCAVLAGTSKGQAAAQTLAEQFHKGWPHIIMVGCRHGYSYLVHLDLVDEEPEEDLGEEEAIQLAKKRAVPIKCKKTVPLTSKSAQIGQ